MAGRIIPDKTAIKEDILNAMSVGAYAVDACASVGISDDTFRRWRKSDAAFAARVSRAQARGWVANLEVIRNAGLAGDWRAATEHLDRTNSPYRKTERFEHSGPGGAPVEVIFKRVTGS